MTEPTSAKSSLTKAQHDRIVELEQAYAALYRRVTWLENILETVIYYMQRRREGGYRRTFWNTFKDDYPHCAAELEKWLEERRDDQT